MTKPARPPFTVEDAERAYELWGCNCGPGALAAIMMITLDAARAAIPGFDEKRYTNPSMMNAALRAIGKPWKKLGACWPNYGLARIQWEGPWTEPGVPMKARYRQTHWVGSGHHNGEHGIFDINCINNGTGWVRRDEWEKTVVPYITEGIPRANGKWHVTHGVEVSP